MTVAPKDVLTPSGKRGHRPRLRAVVVLAVAAILLGGAGLAAYVALAPGAARFRSGLSNGRLVAAGETIYQSHCAACHGINLEGQPEWQSRRPDGRLPAPPHDETGHTWHHADQLLFDITKRGVAAFAGPDYESDMPAFAGVLTDDEIRAVLAFIKSRWPPHAQAYHASINERAGRRE